MDKMQIRAEAVKVLQSVSGYSYSESVLDAAVESGIPEGAQIMNDGDMTVTCEGGKAVARVAGQVVQSMDLVGEIADQSAIMYAVTMARVGSGTGVRA